MGNTFLGRPGAQEWGEAGSVAIHDTQAALVENNTLQTDTQLGLVAWDRVAEAPPTTGRIAGNLILPTSRETVTDNLCIDWSVQDIIVGTADGVSICSNASMNPRDPLNQADCGDATGYVYLDPSDRRHMFNEPLFDAPVIDMETYQRHIVPSVFAEWDAYRLWPVYDPALLDDVFEVRPTHRACAYGATDTCEDP